MSWDKGFNFRATAINGLSDAATDTYVRAGNDLYLTNRNGVDFGWDSGVGLDNGDRFGGAGTEQRLAGDNETTGATARTFRVDLPATGQYKVRLAMGYNAFGNSYTSKIVIKDDTTVRLTIGPHLNTLKEYYDAADVQYTEANWPGSNTESASLTFATTTFYLVLGDGTNLASIAHLFISQVAAASGVHTATLLGVG